MAKRRRYTDKFRAAAVVMLEAQGYPDTKGALTKVANHLKMPTTTLHGWFYQKHNPAPAEIRNEKRDDLIALIEAELRGALEMMKDKRVEAEYRELATAVGILTDKRQILNDKPTSVQRVIVSEQEKHERLNSIIAEYSESPNPRIRA